MDRGKRAIVLDDEAMKIPAEALATQLTALSGGVAAMRRVLTDRAVLVLLANSTGLSMKTCKAVLDAMGNLRKDYVKP